MPTEWSDAPEGEDPFDYNQEQRGKRHIDEKVEVHQPRSNGPNSDYGADGKPSPLEPFDTISIGDRVREPLEQRLFLDGHGFILMHSVHVMNGDGGIGKTDLACQALVATHIGSPLHFLGLAVTNQGPVLMFSAEEPEAEIRRRIHSICDAEGIDPGCVATF